MTRHAYGQGNGPGWAKRMKRNARIAQHVREIDEDELGNRPGIRVVLGLDDEGPTYWVDGYPVPADAILRTLAHRWFTRSAA